MRICHVCGMRWDSHAPDCRVRADLERMRRTRDRMVSEGRGGELLQKMDSYLKLFGELPCQLLERMPVVNDCSKCGHGDVCVIKPAA